MVISYFYYVSLFECACTYMHVHMWALTCLGLFGDQRTVCKDFLPCWCERLKPVPRLGNKFFCPWCHLTSTRDKFLELVCHSLLTTLMVFGVFFIGVSFHFILLAFLFRHLVSSNLAWHSLHSQWGPWAPEILGSTSLVTELQVHITLSGSKLIFNLSYHIIA